MIHDAIPGYNADMRAIERRSYLRISDEATIDWQIVTDNQVTTQTPEAALGLSESFRLRADLYRLELEARELRREISGKDRTLGSFLHNLNRRMELMAGAIINLDAVNQPNVVDLSPAGLCFESDTLYSPQQWLALKLVFSNNSLGIATFARVRYQRLDPAHPETDNHYRVGLQFISNDTTVENLLERYIAARQSEERRSRLHGFR